MLAAQQCDPTNPHCFNVSPAAPQITIVPDGGTFDRDTLVVTIYYSDDFALSGTPTLSATGATILTQPYALDNPSDPRAGRSVVTLLLAPGTNTLQASISDGLQQIGTESAAYTYTPPDPALQRMAPTVSTAPQNGVNRNLALCDGCSEAVLSHSTPAYRSLDQPRSVTLFYSANQADPRGFVWLDVEDRSLDPASTITLQLRDANNALVQFTTGSTSMHFVRGTGRNRIAAQFAAGTLPTGSHLFTAVVTSHWSGQTKTTEVPVRVPVINEGSSVVGSGWSIAGLQRAHSTSDGVLITSGDGQVTFFAKSCSGSTCVYDAPPGEESTLSQEIVGYQAVWRRTYPDGTVAHFAMAGEFQEVVDRFGNQTAYAYDGSGRLSTITDPIGKVTTFGYLNGKLRTITDPTGRVTTLHHTGTRLTRIDAPNNTAVLEPSYNTTTNRLTSWLDVRRAQWNVYYDFAGRVDSVMAPQIAAEGTMLRPLTTIRSREARALVSQTSGTSSSPRAVVPPDSVYRRVTDPKGAQIRMWSDGAGLATRTRSPDGRETVIERFPDGRAWYVEDAEGNSTLFGYAHGDSRVTHSTSRSSSGTVSASITYANFGQPATVTVDGVQATYDYDSSDMLESVTVGSRVTQYTWDSRGRPLTVTDPDNHVTQYQYHTTGALNTYRVTLPDLTTTTFGYDAAGRTTTVTATDNTVSTTYYDSLNRVTRVKDPLNFSTYYTYAGNSRDVTQVLDARNQTFEFQHNALGWVHTEVSPRGRSITYQFDRRGNVIQSTDPAQRVVTATYDTLSRLATRTVNGVTTTFGYDPDRRWVSASNSVSTDTIHFDSKQRPIRNVVRRGTRRFEIGHRYDDMGRRIRIGVLGSTWSDTLSAAYSYDGFGRLNGIRDLMTDAEIAAAVGSGSGGQVFSSNTTELTYNTESLLNGISLPLSGGFNFGYTPTHQIATMGVGGTNGALDLERAYEYGVHGEILTLHNPHELRFRQFVFDNAGRLTESQKWEVGEQLVCDDPMDLNSCSWHPVNNYMGSTTFAWDSVGNPTDRNAVVQTGNRLTSYDGWTMAYDSAGYLISRSKSGSPSQTFGWNGLGQLTSVTTAGVGTVSFEYDGFGRRVRRTSPTSVVSQYLYDGDDLLMELDGNGNRRRAYTHYPGIDQPHSVREFTGTHAGRYYFAMELPGHVIGLLNASGARVNHYGYTAFGKPEHVYETVPNSLRYMAREWDPDAGLYYVRNRWYDPEVGRFISEDPIGLAGGINVYAYAANDPINFTDPLGLQCPGCLAMVEVNVQGCSNPDYVHDEFMICGPRRTTSERGSWTSSGSYYNYGYSNQDNGLGLVPGGGWGGTGHIPPPPPHVMRRGPATPCSNAKFWVAVDTGVLLFPFARIGGTLLRAGWGGRVAVKSAPALDGAAVWGGLRLLPDIQGARSTCGSPDGHIPFWVTEEAAAGITS